MWELLVVMVRLAVSSSCRGHSLSSHCGLLQKFPEVLVYHPNEGNGHAYAVLTWTGFVGAITGYSSVELGVCEKVWLHYKGKDSRAGIPFTFLLRDILQYDTTSTSLAARLWQLLRTSPWPCSAARLLRMWRRTPDETHALSRLQSSRL